MKSDLDLLIKALEDEKKTLEREIKNTISEYDYLIAYYHSEALIRLNRKLSILYSFKDPLYNEKQQLNFLQKRNIKRPAFVKDKETWVRIKKRIEERLKERIEIDRLDLEEKTKNINTFFLDGQEIDDALFDVYEGKCKGFKLTIDDYTEISFDLQNGTLIIAITVLSDHLYFDNPDFVLDNRFSNPFIGLGFKFDADKKQFIYNYKTDNFKDASPVKIILARLLFDVLNLYEINKSAKLIYQ